MRPLLRMSEKYGLKCHEDLMISAVNAGPQTGPSTQQGAAGSLLLPQALGRRGGCCTCVLKNWWQHLVVAHAMAENVSPLPIFEVSCAYYRHSVKNCSRGAQQLR